MVRMIAPLADRIYACQFKVMGRKSVDAEVLAKTARKHTGKPSDVYCRRDPVEAFTEARKNLSKGDALLVVGSFYLVGFIRALYCSEDRILRNRNSEIKIS